MAVGEAQILGQMRTALRESQKSGHAGPALNTLFQQALRVGKRAHTETGIDAVSVSLVEAGLARAERELGALRGLKVLVVGAGGMSSLAATTVARRGAAGLTIVNRTLAKAVRLAERTGGTARPLDELSAALAGRRRGHLLHRVDRRGRRPRDRRRRPGRPGRSPAGLHRPRPAPRRRPPRSPR